LRSGEAWGGCAAYERVHRPDLSLYENVAAIDKKQAGGMTNLDFVKQELAGLQKNTIVFKYTPTQFGVPQDRHRVCILATHHLNGPELRDVGKILDTQLVLNDDEEVLPLDTFLLPKAHEYLGAVLDQRLKAKASKKTVEPKGAPTWTGAKTGVKGKTRAGPKVSSCFASDPVLAARCPWLDCLTDREHNILIATDFRKMIDLSQCRAYNVHCLYRLAHHRDDRSRNLYIGCASAAGPFN
jgi:hypothetical protein